MNIRIFLIALMMLSNRFSLAMNVTKDNSLKHNNRFDLLDEDIAQKTTEIKISKKVKKTSLVAAATTVVNQKTEKKNPVNPNYTFVKNDPDVLEIHKEFIKIHDKKNKIEIYLSPETVKTTKTIKYKQNINTWDNNPSLALQDAKYIDPNSKRYIYSEKKEKETITIHTFSKLVDPFIFTSKQISEIDKKTQQKVTKFILPAIVRIEGSTEKKCCLVYIFNANDECFHRNISFDITEYEGFPYIKVADEFPALSSN